ncbi:Nn.00g113720.m01.CDS01 [Neocucurbitaria sp. VM-36]
MSTWAWAGTSNSICYYKDGPQLGSVFSAEGTDESEYTEGTKSPGRVNNIPIDAVTETLRSAVLHYDFSKMFDVRDFVGVLNPHSYTLSAVLRLFDRGVEPLPSKPSQLQPRLNASVPNTYLHHK